MKFLGWAILLLFAGLVFAYGVLPSFNNTRGDFVNYYTASRLVADGISVARAYHDIPWFQMQLDRYGIVHQVGGFIPQPPPTALGFLPLTFYDAVTAKNIWTVFNIVLVVVIIFALARLTGLDKLAVSVLFLGTGMGLINHFLFGQQYLLLLTTIVLGLVAYQSGRHTLAGVLLAVMIPMKYIGMLFVGYFAWKRQWRVVVAAAATVAIVVGLALWLVGPESFAVFFAEVLPRHLRGEIQDPFAIYFQSWRSLFRRLFVFDATLNAQPLTDAPSLFLFFSSLTFWGILALGYFLVEKYRFAQTRHQFLFEIGMMPLLFLLVSPSGTSYHFLLLTLTVTAYGKILLDTQRQRQAFLLAALFIVVNLPHYMKFMPFAHGWLTPLAYSRLWLLLVFGGVAMWFLRPVAKLRPEPHHLRFVLATVLGLVTFSTISGTAAFADADDGATWLPIAAPAYNRNLGLILENPDLGSQHIVFSYCELRDEQFSIFATDGARWTPVSGQNVYFPDLAADDSTLLVQTVVNGEYYVALSAGRGQVPRLLLPGEHPRWRDNGRSFVYIAHNAIYLASLDSAGPRYRLLVSPGDAEQEVFDLACSRGGDLLAFCTKTTNSGSKIGSYQLRIFDFHGGQVRIVFTDRKRIEQPAWSPGARYLLFAWRQTNNRDLWLLDTQSGNLRQLTHNRGEDTSPVWEAASQRILFTSDRGRGLEFSAIFWLPIPADLLTDATSSSRLLPRMRTNLRE